MPAPTTTRPTKPVVVPPGYILVRFSSKAEFDRWEQAHPGRYHDALWESTKRRVSASILPEDFDNARRFGARPAKPAASQEQPQPPAPESDGLVLPVVHLNGTSRESLAQMYYDAWRVANELHYKLRQPFHLRDYYPLGDAKSAQAREQFAAQMKALEGIRAYLEAHMKHLAG